MENMFDGKKIRDEILKNLADQVAKMDRKPTMAVFLIGDNPVCRQYVELKKKMAEKTGIQFCLYKFEEDDTEKDILEAISFLNNDAETDGIMIQIPLSDKFGRDKFIERINPRKDIDGLRFCAGLESKFKPPVILSILEAIQRSGSDLKNKKIVTLGRGFLVGAPLVKTFDEQGLDYTVVVNETKNLEVKEKSFADAQDDIRNADILISATGNPAIIKPEMVKEGVVLIDAGTAEENGQLVGDIDPEAYEKALYYTPVPGGIGPVTVAMLFQNLVSNYSK